MTRRFIQTVLLVCVMGMGFMVRAGDPATSRLRGMTLEQKVGQMFIASFYGPSVNLETRHMLATWQPGGVVLLPSNLGTPPEVARLTNEVQQIITDAGGPPAFIAIDQEGGLIARLRDGFTSFPVPALLTASGDVDLAERLGGALAVELRAVGVNMNLAPVADVLTNPQNTVIGRRAFGSHPEQVASMVAGVVRGLQSEGVLAVVKHFPGHGATLEDSHLTLPRLNLDLAQLTARELVPFQAAFEADVSATMLAHIWFSAFDPESPVPASLSSAVVTGLLRDTLGYEGLIMTDALDMDAIDTVYSPEQAAIAAIEAGNDLVLLGAHVGPRVLERAMRAVVEAVDSGRISPARIDASVLRILAAKEQYRITGWQPLDPSSVNEALATTDHMSLVSELFRAGVTLVYDDRGAIPIQDEVGIIYPAAEGALRRACAGVPGVRFLGVSRSPTTEEIAWGRDLARNVPTVVVFVRNAVNDPAVQNLVRALPPDKTIVVLLHLLEDVKHLPATSGLIVTYTPMPQSYPVVCDILAGVQPARGLLSIDLEMYRASQP